VSRDETTYVADMVEACARVMEYTAGLDAAGLRADRRTVDAVVRDLEVLGRRPSVSRARFAPARRASLGERSPGCAMC
jgi:uncharacterized protein with HEPN domain